MKLMTKAGCCLLAAVAAIRTFAAEPAAKATVTVDPGRTLGPIKPMNAVNNGPSVKHVSGDMKSGNDVDYQLLRIPAARIHDMPICDINRLFPDFDADETKPENYDFVFSDRYLDGIRRAGTEVFFRLGQTIEHGPKKYGVLPPKDYAKWARICEHVIRHYNEGWGWGADTAYTTHNTAWSNQFNIVRWEIWNEPDLGHNYLRPERNPTTWGGTVTNFFEFYEIAAKHLKGTFPKLMIGGPGAAGYDNWIEDFLAYCRDHRVPIDFFSWHIYSRTTKPAVERSEFIRRTLDRCGYRKAESYLNEWNYVKGWTDDWPYTIDCESGTRRLKGAAFVSAMMTALQGTTTDMLMFYDTRPHSGMNNLFVAGSLFPAKGYYPFYAWRKLRELGTQVASSVAEGAGVDSNANSGFVEKKDKTTAGQFTAVAAKGRDGRLAVLVTRYSDDDNTSDTGTVTLRVAGRPITGGYAYLTDEARSFTQVPLLPCADGSAVFFMQPLSFAYVEF